MTSFFTNNFQYWLMSSANSLVTSGSRVYALAQTGQQYVFYSATTSGFTATVGTSGENFNIYRYDPTTGNTTLIENTAGGSLNFTAGSLTNDYVIYALRTGALPSGWSDANINGSTPAGGASYNSGTGVYTVIGGGTGLASGTTSDKVNFASQSWTGNGTLVACVTSVTSGPTAPVAGLMFRSDGTAGSMFAAVTVTPGAVDFCCRTSAGSAIAVTSVSLSAGYLPSPSAPLWLKLVRNANRFSASYSFDGSTWTDVASQCTSYLFSSSALAGMVVSSANTSQVVSATFDNVSLTAPSSLPGGWSDADLGAAVPAAAVGSAGYVGVGNVASAGISFYPGDGAAIAQMDQFESLRAEYGGYPNTVDLNGDSSSSSNFMSSIWGFFIQAGAWESYGANKPQITISTPLGFGAQNPTPAEATANFNAILSGTYDSAVPVRGQRAGRCRVFERHHPPGLGVRRQLVSLGGDQCAEPVHRRLPTRPQCFDRDFGQPLQVRLVRGGGAVLRRDAGLSW